MIKKLKSPPKKIQDCILNLTLTMPLFTDIMRLMTYYISDEMEIPTICVSSTKNEIKCFIHPDFLKNTEDLQKKENLKNTKYKTKMNYYLNWAMIHEVSHILFMHVGENRRLKFKNSLKRNIVMDMIINDTIQKYFNFDDGYKQKQYPNAPTIPKEYNGKWLSEDLYDWLNKNNYDFKNINPFDSHNKIDTFLKDKINELVNSNKNRGQISSNEYFFIESITKIKFDWRQYLHTFFNTKIGKQKKIELLRPDFKRMKLMEKTLKQYIYIPSIKKYSREINLGIDVSASMLKEDFAKIFGIIEQSKIKINLSIIDTEVKKINNKKYITYKKGMWKTLKMNGKGGTKMQPYFDYIKSIRKNNIPTALFTDGFIEPQLYCNNFKFILILTKNNNVTITGCKYKTIII